MIEVTPEIIAAAAGGLTLIGGTAYALVKGRKVSVDADDDGNDDVTIGPAPRQTVSSEELTPATTESAGDVPPVEEPSSEVDDYEDDVSDHDPTITGEYAEYDGLTDVVGIGPKRAELLKESGIESVSQLDTATDEEILAVNGIGEYALGQIRADLGPDEPNKGVENIETGDVGDDTSIESNE